MTFPTWLELATKNLPTTVAMLVLTSVIYWRFFARRRVLPRAAARGKDRWRANASLLAYLLVTSLLVTSPSDR